jgi:putative transposase
MPVCLRLLPTVHDQSHFRVWQRRFHPFNAHTEQKRREKLNYMHNNTVKRGLVRAAGDWPWSSWRYYFLHDALVLRMDRLD